LKPRRDTPASPRKTRPKSLKHHNTLEGQLGRNVTLWHGGHRRPGKLRSHPIARGGPDNKAICQRREISICSLQRAAAATCDCCRYIWRVTRAGGRLSIVELISRGNLRHDLVRSQSPRIGRSGKSSLMRFPKTGVSLTNVSRSTCATITRSATASGSISRHRLLWCEAIV
jgi:hypothetical protein